MTGLSRCGKPYRTFDAAVLAAEFRMSKGSGPLEVAGCGYGSHWHVIPKGTTIGLRDQRPDRFPPVIAALLDARDEVCQLGGGGPECQGRLERHHRRAKAAGGSSARAHTQCACNGVRLCRKHHEWVHLNPRQARPGGWIVLQSVSLPGSIAMRPWDPFHTVLDGPIPTCCPLTKWPTCEGGWNDQP